MTSSFALTDHSIGGLRNQLLKWLSERTLRRTLHGKLWSDRLTIFAPQVC